MAKTKPYIYPTRFTVPGLPDGKCWARSCMQPGENKGTYAQGRGYTSYYDVPKPVCSRNHLHGCPHPLPEPDPETARCCFRPTYKYQRGAPPRQQECEVCGKHVPRAFAKELNKLPTLGGVACKHEGLVPVLCLTGWYECSCLCVWDHRPLIFEASQFTTEDALAEMKRRVATLAPGGD